VRDTFSNFVVAKIVDVDGDENFAKDVASVVFSTFCQFGFTSCVLVSKNQNFFHPFLQEIDLLWSSLDDIGLRPEPFFNFAEDLSIPGNNLAHKIQEFSADDDWTSKFDAWLFKLRTSIQVKNWTA
jgi:hypothetical protein